METHVKDVSSPASDALLADIIRFIVGAVHPPNEIINSGVVPRYAAVGKLLKHLKVWRFFHCMPQTTIGSARARQFKTRTVLRLDLL